MLQAKEEAETIPRDLFEEIIANVIRVKKEQKEEAERKLREHRA